ncbi:MAG: metallophosphoesterase [Pseudomonadota bacterium]
MSITLHDACLPKGLRVYALGDVHGDHAAASAMLARLRRDLAARPVADWREIWIGDLIDRGPDSAGVLDLALRDETREKRIVLLGNHDAYLRDFLATGDSTILSPWLTYGGVQSCASWGIDRLTLNETIDRHGASGLRDMLEARVPERQWRLVEEMPTHAVLGDFLFVHAGIRPGIALDAQDPRDLIWIRGNFLDHAEPHSHVVVHGHTPSPEIEMMPNRIGIDTGAGKGGHLSCLVLEGDAVGHLTEEGVVSLL